MVYFQNGPDVEVSGITDFDPAQTFECGQCFRWTSGGASSAVGDENGENAVDGSYVGVVRGQAARVRKAHGSLFISGTVADFERLWRPYFDLDRDYAAIRASLCIDAYMTQAALCAAGIRILKQDPWEALCSFIVSQCNNIPRIKLIIEKFCSLYGEPIAFEGCTLYSFPSAERTARLSAEDLAPLRCGYRAPYILEAARAVADGRIDFDALAAGTPESAVTALKILPGVGEKVASCAVLFGLHMLDAFPVDTWIKKVITANYGQSFNPSVFSPYAGIAQQYMFFHARNVALQSGKETVRRGL